MLCKTIRSKGTGVPGYTPGVFLFLESFFFYKKKAIEKKLKVLDLE